MSKETLSSCDQGNIVSPQHLPSQLRGLKLRGVKRLFKGEIVQGHTVTKRDHDPPIF